MRERFLIVRLSGIGDVVMASTLARRIRTTRPDAHITWLTGMVAAPLVETFEAVDSVIVVDEKKLLRGRFLDRTRVLLSLWPALLRANPAIVMMLHPDWRYAALTWCLPRARRTRVSRRRRNTALIPGRYMGDDYARLLDTLDDGADVTDEGPISGHYPLGQVRAFAKTAEYDSMGAARARGRA